MELIARRLDILIDAPSKSLYDAGFVTILVNKQLPLPVQWKKSAHKLARVLRQAGNQPLLLNGVYG